MRAALTAVLALLLAGGWLAEVNAQPLVDAEQLFEQATDAIGADKLEYAATLLEQATAAAEAAGNQRIAAESLFLLGELYEDSLDRPGDAAVAYRRIRTRYPDARAAVAAGRRLESLEQLLGEGRGDADRLARFLAMRREGNDREAAESLELADALLAEDPEWISAPRVRLWMAGVALRDGRRERAERLYLEALDSTDPDVLFEARMAASALVRQRGDYKKARALAEAIDPGGVPGRFQARRDALQAVDRAEARASVAIYARIYLVLFPLLMLGLIAYRVRSARKVAAALWPPPTETIYLTPVLTIFIIASFTGHVGIAGAVVIVAIAGAIVSWLAGAALRAVPRSWATSIAVAMSCAVAVAATFYLALLRGGLVDLIISTVRFGPDI